MDKYQLTPEEMMVIELLFLADPEDDREPLAKYANLNVTKHRLWEVMQSLQAKGVLLKSAKYYEGMVPPNKPGWVHWNSIFLNNYRKCSGELGEEFFNAYPNDCIIGNQVVMLRNFAKKFNDITDFFRAYGKAIGWKQEKHKEVLELIQWAKEHNGVGLNMNIGDFVISRMWESIKNLKNGDRSGLTFDTTTSI